MKYEVRHKLTGNLLDVASSDKAAARIVHCMNAHSERTGRADIYHSIPDTSHISIHELDLPEWALGLMIKKGL